MRAIFVSMALFITTFLFGQNIVGYEYFVDDYVKAGDGTYIAFQETGEDTIVLNEIDFQYLEAGPHILFVRVKDENGAWSHTSKRVFTRFIEPVENGIACIEYFIDEYEKPGDGTYLALQEPAEDTLLINEIDFQNLSEGPHILYIRVKDEKGVWSHTSKRVFNRFIEAEENEIAGIEYFIDEYQKPGDGNFIDYSDDQIYEIDISLLNKGAHVLFTRVKDEHGVWSHTSKRVFMVRD